ncbi:hypothetical protein [Alkalihalobacterium alkalinitrilicum]|uniref:hypothetical protein n=1 Tax=Alkalihalobacterium alkalinitrilicum TaxID=427920 RepID=UPI0009959560|nr:hypothetical protein [Alkalihalobacterium alkalinitrilicum]
MKLILKVIAIFCFVMIVAGCKQDTSAPIVSDDEVQTVDDHVHSAEEIVFPTEIPHRSEEVVFILSNDDGRQTENAIPIFDRNQLMTTIYFMLVNFNPDQEVYAFLNEDFLTVFTTEDVLESEFSIIGDLLEPDIYTISIFQFEEDNPKNTVLNFADAKFKIE